MMKPVLLVIVKLTEPYLARARQTYEVIYEADPARREQAIQTHGKDVQIVLTNGIAGLTAEEMQQMPRLELVCTTGAGYERLDVDYAHAHGIAAANGAGTNAHCVADHAMALLLATVRQVVYLDHACRRGVWRSDVALPANVSEKKMGIIGLGTIGQLIAKRAVGFEIEVGYHNRHQRQNVPYSYFGNVLEMAQWADYLMVATPGGAQTHHMVNAQVLEALGPAGYVVNVGRGSVVDTQALAQALKNKTIAGAGLDVYESEPSPPADLIGFDTLVITPHVGGWSPEAIANSEQRFLDNARLHFAGQPMISPI